MLNAFTRAVLACVLLFTVADPASADITGFLGITTTPAVRPASGVAVGMGLLFLGFEFEYGQTAERPSEGAPGLKTAMGNVLIQTPVPIAGIQPYLTTGAGGYRERWGDNTESSFGLNTGGGAKLTLVGPVRIRIDYRRFTLRGAPREDIAHRLYVGANLAF